MEKEVKPISMRYVAMPAEQKPALPDRRKRVKVGGISTQTRRQKREADGI